MKTLILTLCFLLVGSPAIAQSPAELAPPDTQVFIHIDDAAEWFEALTQGPAGEDFREEMEAAEGWMGLMALLDTDTDAFMETYFGGDVVIFGPSAGEDGQGVIFTQVAPDDALYARESLFLEHVADIGDATIYQTADGGGYIAMKEGWVALCDINSLDYLRDVLARGADAPSLADSDAYAHWTGLLPEDRSATIYITQGEGETHTLGAVREGGNLDVAYFGESENFEELLSILGESSVADFGPLPSDTLMAVTFNLAAQADADNTELMQGLDMLAAPASFAQDILPKLGSPTVLFMSSVAGDAVEPEVDLDLPVFGFAIKMDDDSAADDLKLMLDRLMLLGNLATIQWGVAPIEFGTGNYEGASYNIAHLGKPLAEQTGWDEFEPMQLVYGQVGDYYLICTQEVFFKQCVDAVAAGQPLQIDIEGPVHDLAQTPILALTARPDAVAEMLTSWSSFLEDADIAGLLDAEINVPEAILGLDDAAAMMQRYSLMKVQLWRGEGNLVVGRFQLTAPF